MDITKTLAQNIVKTRYEDLPEEVREATKRSILDTLGVMFPPTTLEKACISLNKLVKEEGGRKESTIVGFGGKAPCRMAALVNGSLVHPLDYDDTTDKPPHHPSASTFPSALAIAEKIGKTSGKDFITAIALGNDLGVRLASAPTGSLLVDYPWFSITNFGVFSATTASGKILGLSEEKMINALGIALHRVFGITEAITAPNSEIRAIRDSFTNKEGVLSALMADREIAACKDAFEKFFKFFYRDEYDPQALTSELGKKFRGAEASLKPWPACRETHGHIQAALDIIKEHNIEPDQIEEVNSTVGEFLRDFLCEPIAIKQAPKLSIDAKFSLPFVVGVALTKRKVEIASFLPQNLRDSKVLEMAKKVTYNVNPEFGVITPALMDIKTKDGKSFSKRVDIVYGNPQNPLSKVDLIAKFKDCIHYAEKSLPPPNIEQLIDKILKLEDVNDIREITGLLG